MLRTSLRSDQGQYGGLYAEFLSSNAQEFIEDERKAGAGGKSKDS